MLGLVGISAVLQALGLGNRVVAGIALVAGGLALDLAARRQLRLPTRRSRPSVSPSTAAGAVLVLADGGVHQSVLAPGAVAGSLLLIAGPWLWRLAVERDAERAARIRVEERDEMAARVHDSVLQTLALIQRHAAEPRKVAAYARRQERELRTWLYGDRIGERRGLARQPPVGGGRGRRGAPRRPGRARELRRLSRRRSRERGRPGRARGDGEQRPALRLRRRRRLRRGRRRGDLRLRPRPRHRLRPGRRRRPTAAGSPTRSGGGCSGPEARRPSPARRARAPRSS